MDTLSVILIAVGAFAALVLLTAYSFKSTLIINSHKKRIEANKQDEELLSDTPDVEEKEIQK